MNERDALRYAARRAMLLAAVRNGDALLAARAAGRLRVPGTAIAPSELALAREARRAVGRAIVNARLPRRAAQPLRSEPAISAPLPSRRPYAVAAGLTAALVVALLFSQGAGLAPGETGGAPEVVATEPQRAALLAVSRGRTISLADEIVAVQESPTPAPTVAPTAAPTASAAPARTGTPATTSGSGAGRTPTATGSGSGGAGGGGGIGLLPSPTPVPRPTATPPVPPAGFGRFSIVVYDASTGRPLPDVCVIVGTITCGAPGTITDVSGRWSADVPATAATTQWDVSFTKTGYATLRRTLQLSAGRTVTYQIFLRRR